LEKMCWLRRGVRWRLACASKCLAIMVKKPFPSWWSSQKYKNIDIWIRFKCQISWQCGQKSWNYSVFQFRKRNFLYAWSRKKSKSSLKFKITADGGWKSLTDSCITSNVVHRQTKLRVSFKSRGLDVYILARTWRKTWILYEQKITNPTMYE
jgi:hypothetical protein